MCSYQLDINDIVTGGNGVCGPYTRLVTPAKPLGCG